MNLDLQDNKNEYFPALGLNATLDEIQSYINDNTSKTEIVTVASNKLLNDLLDGFTIGSEVPTGYLRIIRNILVKTTFNGVKHNLVGDTYIAGTITNYVTNAIKAIKAVPYRNQVLEDQDILLYQGQSLNLSADNNATSGNCGLVFIIIYNEIPVTALESAITI